MIAGRWRRFLSSFFLKEKGASLADLRVIESTQSAVERLKELQQKHPEQTLRIAIEPGGCHGFQYKFTLDDPQKKLNDDIEFVEGKENVKVLCDPVTWSMIKSAKLDFSRELIGAAFHIIDNPAVATGCGCGVSFDLKHD